MTISRRLRRLETSSPPIASIEVSVSDEAEAESRFTDALLQCSPGPICIGMTIAGTRTEWRGTLLPHEERLALMEGPTR